MTVADIPFAIMATDLEGWGYSAADFRRLLRLDPRGCLKAVAGGRRVGITTATSYGKVGWVGNVIVLPKHRGQGIGLSLVEAATRYLERKGAETVRLNSYVQKTGFYESIGFKKEFENLRFHGRLPVRGRSDMTNALTSVRRVAEFDERYFGASRRRLLSILKLEFERTFLVSDGGDFSGFLVGQTTGRSCEVAPFVCSSRNPETPITLWRELATMLPGAEVALTAPAVSGQAMRFARTAGLKAGFRTLRMYRGRKAHMGRPEGVIGLGGLEKG